MTAPEFRPFASIPRLSRDMIVFHAKSGALFKKTLGGDGHKGAV